MKRAFGIFVLALLAGGAAVLPALGEPGAQDRYGKCLALTNTDARAALASAEAWERTGGGVPARHCGAVALVALGRYDEAGGRLDALARDKAVSDISLRASLLDQAGNAWILAGQPAKAEASFTAALTISARDPDLFADLARAKAMGKDWSAAETDLTAALSLAPGRADLLVLRASARDALGRPKDAFADVDRVLLDHPQNADALVLRGTLKLEAGDKNGARADWLHAMAADPKSAAAKTARDHLAAIGAPVKPVPQ